MVYRSFAEMERRDPLTGLTHEGMRNAGLLGGSVVDTSDFSDERLVFSADSNGNIEVDPLDVERAIESFVAADVARLGLTPMLLQPSSTFELVKDAYEIIAADTNYGFVDFSAHYFECLSRAFMNSELLKEDTIKDVEVHLSQTALVATVATDYRQVA